MSPVARLVRRSLSRLVKCEGPVHQSRSELVYASESNLMALGGGRLCC